MNASPGKHTRKSSSTSTKGVAISESISAEPVDDRPIGSKPCSCAASQLPSDFWRETCSLPGAGASVHEESINWIGKGVSPYYGNAKFCLSSLPGCCGTCLPIADVFSLVLFRCVNLMSFQSPRSKPGHLRELSSIEGTPRPQSKEAPPISALHFKNDRFLKRKVPRKICNATLE